jgi:hypothetical protein
MLPSLLSSVTLAPLIPAHIAGTIPKGNNTQVHAMLTITFSCNLRYDPPQDHTQTQQKGPPMITTGRC